MAVTRDIYADFTNGRLVKSNRDANPANFPSPFHQESLRLVIHPLEIDPSRAPNLGPFAEIDPTGIILTVAIFAVADTGTPLALQSSWAVEGNTLVGTLNCNTAEMDAAIGEGDSVDAIIEFEFEDSNEAEQTIQQRITINREYIVDAIPSPIPNETFLSENASLALFLLKEGTAGEGRIWVSPDGTKKVFQFLDNNGVMQYVPVT